MLKGLTSKVVRTKPQGPAVTSCSLSFTAQQTPPHVPSIAVSSYKISGFSVPTASLKPVKTAFYSGAGGRGNGTHHQKRATGQLRDQCRKRNSQGSVCPTGWKWAWRVGQCTHRVAETLGATAFQHSSRPRLLQTVMSSAAELSLRACGTINQ